MAGLIPYHTMANDCKPDAVHENSEFFLETKFLLCDVVFAGFFAVELRHVQELEPEFLTARKVSFFLTSRLFSKKGFQTTDSLLR